MSNQQTMQQLFQSVADELEQKENKTCYLGMKEQVQEALHHFMAAMFPCIYASMQQVCPAETIQNHLAEGYLALEQALEHIVPKEQAEQQAKTLIEALPKIKAMLQTDVQAGYEGDPAANSLDEIMLSYPAFTAISIYRIAHALYQLQIPLIPRMMTEYAHQLTGIDIHPGAVIGPYFFIDHGTGVVIGETTTIGEHVKLYQHVTLGAKSFEVNADGSLVKGVKRHPDIGSHVVIYAGATILGGNTHIGDHCVIGGNVWLTHSVAEHHTVLANGMIRKSGQTGE